MVQLSHVPMFATSQLVCGLEALSAAIPTPVHKGIRLQVSTVPEDPNEQVFCGDVEVKTSTDDQANETNAERDHLDGLSSRAEGWRCDPFAAPSIDDQREGEVGGGH